MNFCHRDDAVAFVLAALARGAAGAAYHGSDGASPTRREVVTHLAGRLGIEPGRHAGPDPGGPDRCILSAWTRAVLGVTLRYPTFREGFEALLAAGTAG
jgi:nucleoside-diphosphate-sugar epimerase